MQSGDRTTIRILAECQAIGGSVPSPTESSLIGKTITRTFNLDILSLEGSFKVEDQEYVLDGTTLTFELSPIEL